MSKFRGYLLKFGDNIFPHKYLAQNPKFTPNRRTEAEAFRDANNDLHRITINNHKSTFEITTIPGLTIEQKIEIEEAMKSGLVGEVERKYLIEFWNEDIGVNDYKIGYFYLADVSYSQEKIEGNTIVYDAITYLFIQY